MGEDWNVMFNSNGGMFGCGGTAAPEVPTPRREEADPAETCNRTFLTEAERQSLDYHLCLLEQNLEIHEDFKKSKLMIDIYKVDNALNPIEDQVEFIDDPWQATKNYIFGLARWANYQVDNRLLLSAARNCLELFKISRDEDHLKKAQHYLDLAGKNENTNLSFDTYERLPWEETIWPVEAYFEIKLAKLEINQLSDPVLFEKLTREVDSDIHNTRLLAAQRSNPLAAAGYSNRLSVMETEMLLSRENPDLDRAMQKTTDNYYWFVTQQKMNVAYLTNLGMDLKDLKYDELRTQNLIGKIHLQKGEYALAAAAFQAVYNAPESTRQYGGFIGLGVDAFFNLFYLALLTSSSPDEASQKLAGLVDLDHIPRDLREELGLELREESWCEDYTTRTYLPCPNPRDTLGNFSLWLDISWLRPEDTRTVLSEIPLDQTSPREKLEIVMKAFELTVTDPKLKEAVKNQWMSLTYQFALLPLPALPSGPVSPTPSGIKLVSDLNQYDPALWRMASGYANGDPFNVGWRSDQITFADGIMTIQLDDNGCPGACSGKPYASGEYRTYQEIYGYGNYAVRMKSARGNGLVSSFFIYTGKWGEKNHHEIDLEFLGKNCTVVQTNYYTAGRGNHEEMIPLGFDACADFHDYGFKWTKEELVFLVDGIPKRTVTEDLPYQPGRIMVNLWSGTGVDGWLNPFTYRGPVQAQYDWIHYSAMKKEEIKP